MRFSIAALSAKRNRRRRAVTIRDIRPPAVLASDLFRAAYLPVVEHWTAGLPRIEATYARALSSLTTDSPADAQSALDDIASAFDRLFMLLTPELRDWAFRVESWQRRKWTAAVLSASGVDLSTMLGVGDVRQTVEATVAWNTSLIRDVSDQMRQRIGNAVFAGLRARTPAAELARTIREAVGMGRRRSMLIASDQLSKLTGALAQERRRQAGIDVYRYRHSGKLHPRSWHRGRDGLIFAEEAFDGERRVNGEVVHAPIAPDDRASIPPWCGCREQAVIDWDNLLD